MCVRNDRFTDKTCGGRCEARRRCGKTRHATFPDLMETNENKEAGKQPLSPGLRTAHAIISHAPVSADKDTV